MGLGHQNSEAEIFREAKRVRLSGEAGEGWALMHFDVAYYQGRTGHALHVVLCYIGLLSCSGYTFPKCCCDVRDDHRTFSCPRIRAIDERSQRLYHEGIGIAGLW
jgi:hypothetical protein